MTINQLITIKNELYGFIIRYKTINVIIRVIVNKSANNIKTINYLLSQSIEHKKKTTIYADGIPGPGFE
jgi:hypothetical protein